MLCAENKAQDLSRSSSTTRLENKDFLQKTITVNDFIPSVFIRRSYARYNVKLNIITSIEHQKIRYDMRSVIKVHLAADSISF